MDGTNATGFTQVLEEKTVSGAVPKTYTVGLDVIAQATAAAVVQYLLYDGHGSTRGLLDASAGVVLKNGTIRQFLRTMPRSLVYWDYVLEDGLAWGSVGRHWAEVTRLLQFPAATTAPDDDTGHAGLIYYRGLGRWWHNRSDVEWLAGLKATRGSGSKGFQLLGDLVGGITAGDLAVLQKGFSRYVEYFLKRRDHAEQFPLAATFLWNVAKKDGIIVELPEDIAKFLFEIPDSYWAAQA